MHHVDQITPDYKKRSLSKSFLSAFRGLGHALSERNFLIQVIIGALTIILAFALDLNAIERIIILILIALVLGAEILNSAIETFVDVLIKEHNEAAAKVKEFMAGAVLIFSITAFVIGVWIFMKAIFFNF
ncbi:MAG: diacylglycerol kinase [Patescibacteria group bacterium]|nr:diacylglycerol kinase [Patescibacteria group bacterium]